MLEAVLLAAKVYLDHCAAVGAAIEAVLAAAKATKQQLAAAARDTRECCQAVAEAAAGRWSKLLGSRARGGEGAGAGNIIRCVARLGERLGEWRDGGLRFGVCLRSSKQGKWAA